MDHSSNTYDRLPSSHDAAYEDLAQEIKLLRDEAVMQSREAASLRVHIGELKQQLASADEAIEVAELGNADRIEQLEAANKSLNRLLGDHFNPRVAAAALIYKEITGREQPMDRTAEDILAEIKHAVGCCDSITWAQPVLLTYLIDVTGHIDGPMPDDIVLFQELGATFTLKTSSNPSFHHFSISSVKHHGAQY